jgi:hypothetical protein
MTHWVELGLADKLRIVADRCPGAVRWLLNSVADRLEGLT